MTPFAWTIIGIACLAVAVFLLFIAWRIRHQDVMWKRLMNARYGKFAVPLPLCCQSGVDDLSKTTITGAWTCPSCGRFHTFVDGQPGKIDL